LTLYVRYIRDPDRMCPGATSGREFCAFFCDRCKRGGLVTAPAWGWTTARITAEDGRLQEPGVATGGGSGDWPTPTGEAYLYGHDVKGFAELMEHAMNEALKDMDKTLESRYGSRK